MTAVRSPSAPTILHPSAELAKFATALKFEDIPEAVASRCEDLLLDTMASILAGSTARPVKAIAKYADLMGPATGLSEDYVNRRLTSPMFAAMVNAAAAHVVEQDDVHNGSVFHPAAVIFPPAIAVAQAIGASGKDMITAAVAGYEVGIRIGEFLGRSHYKIFHTTGTAGTVAAAVTVGKLLKLDVEQMLNAIGSGGTQAAGLWEFLRDAADSKQWPDSGLSCKRRLYWRTTHIGRFARHGGRNVYRRGPRQTRRSLRYTLGFGRNLIQISCLLSPHASSC